MIVDFHTHVFPDHIAAAALQKLAAQARLTPFTDATAGGLAASMVQAGVDCSVVLPVATSPRQVASINDASIRLNGEGLGLLCFGCMHPDFPGWREELSRIAGHGIQGVKIHPVYQDVALDDVRYLRILDRCGELGLMVLAHAGVDIGYPEKINCTPEMALRAVEQAGPATLILAHMGGWRSWDEAEALLARTGVYLDTAFSLGNIPSNGDGWRHLDSLEMLSAERFVRMVRAFGAHRILFGTDSPWQGQREAVAQIKALPLAPEERAAILGGNAQRLLGIS